MDTQNNLDSSPEMGYNVNNNEHMIVVKLDEQKPVHDTSCKHSTLLPDPDDRIGDAIYHGCTNPQCGVGFYIQPE